MDRVCGSSLPSFLASKLWILPGTDLLACLQYEYIAKKLLDVGIKVDPRRIQEAMVRNSKKAQVRPHAPLQT